MNKIISLKTICIVSLVTLLLFMTAGCSFGNSGIPQDLPKIDVHTGSEGLSVEFLDELPPSTLYENNDFRIGLLLHNKGASDILNAHVRLTGFQDQYFTLNKDHFQVDLEGKSLYNDAGELTYEYIDASSKEIHDVLDYVEFPLTVTSCYKYYTYASADICLEKPDLPALSKNGCGSEISNLPSTQGGPVGVRSIDIEKIPSQNKITYLFKIDVVNFGDGELRLPDAYEKDCIGPVLEPNEVNRFVMEVSLGNEKLSCRQDSKPASNDIFILPEKITSIIPDDSDDDHRIVCEFKSDRDITTYTTKLSMNIHYGYVDSLTKQITMYQYDESD